MCKNGNALFDQLWRMVFHVRVHECKTTASPSHHPLHWWARLLADCLLSWYCVSQTPTMGLDLLNILSSSVGCTGFPSSYIIVLRIRNIFFILCDARSDTLSCFKSPCITSKYVTMLDFWQSRPLYWNKWKHSPTGSSQLSCPYQQRIRCPVMDQSVC